MPGMHLRHANMPDAGWLRPFEQTLQITLRATSDEYLPKEQSMQRVCASLLEYLPGMQFKHAVLPFSGCTFPSWQTVHSRSSAVAEDDLPTMQSMHSVCLA